jgi:uncharacterized membrane protein YvbJ
MPKKLPKKSRHDVALDESIKQVKIAKDKNKDPELTLTLKNIAKQLGNIPHYGPHCPVQ